MKKLFLGSAVCLVLFTACGSAVEPVSKVDIDAAQAALQPFKERMLAALTGVLEEGTPESAISVCREQAPAIAAELSIDGVRMGRTSHKLRNPANAPEPWVEPLLAAYLEDPGNLEPRAVRIDEATIGYVEPIKLASFCLSCHGPRIEPDLLDEIGALYPEDEAVGFAAGDLRGLFWVTLPVAGT